MTCRIIGWVVGGLAALALAGCAGSRSSALGQEEAAGSSAGEVQVTGSVFYLERIGLTPEAVLQVAVVEQGGAKGRTVVGEQTVRGPGQTPLRFSVSVPARRVRPEAHYTVQAWIIDGERLLSSPEPVPVLTQGHPRDDVQVRVRVGVQSAP